MHPITATDLSNKSARDASRQSCRAIQNTLVTVISLMRAKARQIATDTDAASDRFLKRIRGHLPDWVMQSLGSSGRVLEQDPEHDGGKQRDRGLDLPDRHRVASASDQQRELVNRNKARKKNRINSPGEWDIAAEPKWTPSQPADQCPQQYPVHNGAVSRGIYRPDRTSPLSRAPSFKATRTNSLTLSNSRDRN